MTLLEQTACDAKLYLGALPIKTSFYGKPIRNDCDSLTRHLGIQVVLSVTELYELQFNGWFVSAIFPKEWEQKEALQLLSPVPDFSTYDDLNQLDQAVELIHWSLATGRSIYVHCKAGRGRSVLVVVCYLMKYQGMNFEGAYRHVKQCRPQVYLEAIKQKTARDYLWRINSQTLNGKKVD